MTAGDAPRRLQTENVDGVVTPQNAPFKPQNSEDSYFRPSGKRSLDSDLRRSISQSCLALSRNRRTDPMGQETTHFLLDSKIERARLRQKNGCRGMNKLKSVSSSPITLLSPHSRLSVHPRDADNWKIPFDTTSPDAVRTQHLLVNEARARTDELEKEAFRNDILKRQQWLGARRDKEAALREAWDAKASVRQARMDHNFSQAELQLQYRVGVLTAKSDAKGARCDRIAATQKQHYDDVRDAHRAASLAQSEAAAASRAQQQAKRDEQAAFQTAVSALRREEKKGLRGLAEAKQRVWDHYRQMTDDTRARFAEASAFDVRRRDSTRDGLITKLEGGHNRAQNMCAAKAGSVHLKRAQADSLVNANKLALERQKAAWHEYKGAREWCAEHKMKQWHQRKEQHETLMCQTRKEHVIAADQAAEADRRHALSSLVPGLAVQSA